MTIKNSKITHSKIQYRWFLKLKVGLLHYTDV